MSDLETLSSQVEFCIATDCLVPELGRALIAAQLAVKAEFERLLNKSKPIDGFLTALPSSTPDFDRNLPMPSPWHFTECPEKVMEALQICKLWVLFTDGKQEGDMDRFDLRVSLLFVTSYPSIHILFDSCAAGPPQSTKYDAGSQVVSESQDAILLFHDIDTSQFYVLRAKGCFETLKDGRITIDDDKGWESCKWANLQRVDYEELLSVKLPLRFGTGPSGQLILHKGRIMPKKEYEMLKAEEDVGDKVDVERLQEIIKKAAENKMYSPLYSKPTLPSSTIPRVDTNGQTSHILEMLLLNLDLQGMGLDVSESRIEEYRSELRAANTANRLAFQEAAAKKTQEDLEKQQSARKSFLLPVADPEEIFLPGFVRAPLLNRRNSEFRGRCMLCHEEDTILVLLAHQPDLETPDYLKCIFLSFVFHPMLVCDACAFNVPSQHAYFDRDIFATLPLVSVIDNEAAWLRAFRQIISLDVHDDEILMLAYKWFSTQIGLDVEELEEGCYKDAMRWVLKDLGKWENTTRNRRFDTKPICF